MSSIKNKWSKESVYKAINRKFKAKFKKKISITDVNKIWESYLKEEVLNNLEVGAIVNIDSKTRIWVKAIPILENKTVMSLLDKGLMYVGGRITKAKLNYDNSDYVYKIMFESDRFKGGTKLYFKAHESLSNAVRTGVINGKLITRLECR